MASGLFDASYYLAKNPDIASIALDPLGHYLERGWSEGRDPSPHFDTRWYLEKYPEVARTGVNPLYHYLRCGGFIGHNPSARFDSAWYLEQHPDVGREGTNPLVHYVGWGQFEGRLTRRPGLQHDGRVLSQYESWLAVNELSDRDVAELRKKIDERAGRLPKISVVTPVHNTDPRFLEQAFESVKSQIYENWEICFVDDASNAEYIGIMLDRFAKSDRRVRTNTLVKNSGISIATNSGVGMSVGEVILFLDHDDLLTRDCLAEIAIYYADHPNADMVYSDDDKIDLDGRRYAPQFKPDWSPTLLLSWMYMSHVYSVRKELFERLGGFRSQFDGSQDYDFALRAAEFARHVGHIPKVLYHWRAVEGSTATSGEAKPESMHRGLRAVQEALDRRGFQDAKVLHPLWASTANVGMFDIEFPDDGPSITVVILTRNHDSLQNCVESLKLTTYKNYKILVLDNGNSGPETMDYLRSAQLTDIVSVVRTDNMQPDSNVAQLYNESMHYCSSDYLLFLSNGIEVFEPRWLSQMVGYARLAGVGVVGARLHFEDGTLQHAGIVHGYHDGLAGQAFRGLKPDDWGYLGFVRSSRECSAVASACLLTPRTLFESLGGFDERRFATAYYGVDYCYRVVKSGRVCLYCASAGLRNREDTNNIDDDVTERIDFRRHYGNWRDRWYNPNLSLENEWFEIEATRPETSSKIPIRLVAVTHNLNNEGAPTTLMDLLICLSRKGVVNPLVLSPADGPLREQYEAAGIEVRVLSGVMHGVKDAATQLAGLAGIGTLMAAVGAEVVLANTLRSYWAIKGATIAGIPSIWLQHESDPWENYFDYLPHTMRSKAYEAFAEAYCVLYVAEATKRAWLPLQRRRNFKVIRHGIPLGRLAAETRRWSRSSARQKLKVPADAMVLSVVGTVCRRKGQLDIVEAYEKLPSALRDKVYIYIVGKVGEPEYGDLLKTMVGNGLPNVVLTDHVQDPFLYYSASDISVCTSRIESAPRMIIEAMACGLPIITTPVFGIPELVRENINALFYDPGDSTALAGAIESLSSDHVLRERLAIASPKVLDGQPGFDQMVERYTRVIRQAVNLQLPQ